MKFLLLTIGLVLTSFINAKKQCCQIEDYSKKFEVLDSCDDKIHKLKFDYEEIEEGLTNKEVNCLSIFFRDQLNKKAK